MHPTASPGGARFPAKPGLIQFDVPRAGLSAMAPSPMGTSGSAFRGVGFRGGNCVNSAGDNAAFRATTTLASCTFASIQPFDFFSQFRPQRGYRLLVVGQGLSQLSAGDFVGLFLPAEEPLSGILEILDAGGERNDSVVCHDDDECFRWRRDLSPVMAFV